MAAPKAASVFKLKKEPNQNNMEEPAADELNSSTPTSWNAVGQDATAPAEMVEIVDSSEEEIQG